MAFPHKEKAKVGFTNSPFENKPVAAIDPAIRPPQTTEPNIPNSKFYMAIFFFIYCVHPGNEPWSMFIKILLKNINKSIEYITIEL